MATLLDLAKIVLVTGYFILGTLIAIYLYKVSKFFQYLKLNHIELWNSLGSPHIIFNNTISNNLKFSRFLKNNLPKKYVDEHLVNEKRKIRLLRITAMSLFFFLFALFFVVSMQGE